MNFHGLAIDITKSDRLGTTLRTDSSLKQAVVAEAQLIKEDYDWLLNAQGSAYQNFKAWRNSVFASEQFNDDAKLLMTWLGADEPWAERNGKPSMIEMETRSVHAAHYF